MNAITMLDTIVPKSDQLNSDDLIGGPRTITLTKVSLTGDEQPVALHFEGDNGKPYKPGKSMRRVLVHVWGPDANVYAGRSMTLYRDDKVMFGGVAVGGTRISHMSHIERDVTFALTTTRANRKPYTVKPLRSQDRARQAPAAAQRGREETRSFGPSDDGFPGDREDADVSAAVRWMHGVFSALEGDVFSSRADIDAFFANPDNQARFAELADEDEAASKRVVAALNGRGKALAGRRG
jgi:hypothetical protein